MKAVGGVSVIAISASMLVCTAVAAHMLRYEVLPWGSSVVVVQDRWLGTVERCVGAGHSKCLPILSAGMEPIPVPTEAHRAKPKMTDEEFHRLMSNLGLGAGGMGSNPQAGQ